LFFNIDPLFPAISLAVGRKKIESFYNSLKHPVCNDPPVPRTDWSLSQVLSFCNNNVDKGKRASPSTIATSEMQLGLQCNRHTRLVTRLVESKKSWIIVCN